MNPIRAACPDYVNEFNVRRDTLYPIVAQKQSSEVLVGSRQFTTVNLSLL